MSDKNWISGFQDIGVSFMSEGISRTVFVRTVPIRARMFRTRVPDIRNIEDLMMTRKKKKNLHNATARTARLAREVDNFETTPPWGIKCVPEKEDNFDVLLVDLMGPKGSPYERGTFKLTITIPEKYPFEPPLVKFTTPVYHPNIDKGGRICMDMLKMPPKGGWLPTITLETLLVSLQTLLANPNPDDPLMMDVANEYKYEYDNFIDNAKKYTEKYAV